MILSTALGSLDRVAMSAHDTHADTDTLLPRETAIIALCGVATDGRESALSSLAYVASWKALFGNLEIAFK
jgi:hypothetical protein